MTGLSLRELESRNPAQPEGVCHPGGKWCLLCGRVYPWPGHTRDCILNGYISKENLKSLKEG